jgi:quercetin dioxygenase-like cupin family protein
VIDPYYHHGVDPRTPIEDAAGGFRFGRPVSRAGDEGNRPLTSGFARREGRMMKRSHLALAVAIAAGIGAMTLAGDDAPDKGKPTVKQLSTTDIAENVDGKKSKAATVEVTLEPGQAGTPHRHPGPVFGYVLGGEYEWAIDDNPAKTLKAGDTFYEPTGCLHRVSKNAGKTKTRVLAVLLVPQDTKELSIPEKPAK